MRLRLVIRPEAADELRAAKRWYDAQRVGLGREMAAEVARAIAVAREEPERFPIVEGEIRRALLHRFPYGVFFRARSHELVVVAVFHLHRDPATLQDRG